MPDAIFWIKFFRKVFDGEVCAVFGVFSAVFVNESETASIVTSMYFI